MWSLKEFGIVATYIATAFLLPLICLVAMLYNGENSVLNFILYGLEAASPSIAAIVSIAVFEGQKGIKTFFKTNFTPKMKAITILSPILFSSVIMLSAKVVTFLLMETPFKINHLTAKEMIVIAWAFFAEEIGWRGYLHKKLAYVIPEFIVPFILGLIWAAWHYHFFVFGSIKVPIFWFTVGCITDSYIYLFLLKMSHGNILIAMLYHMSGNFFINLFSINPDMNGGSSISYILSVFITGTLGIGLNALFKNERDTSRT